MVDVSAIPSARMADKELGVVWASRADGLADLFAGRTELICYVTAKLGTRLGSKKESHRRPDQRSGSEKCYGTE